MKIKFKKYHGLGNDFIIIDTREIILPNSFLNNKTLLKKLCDRNFGIGADGIILMMKPTLNADIKMKIINSDGSQPEMCGNGIRCLIRFIHDLDLSTDKSSYHVETDSGILLAEIKEDKEIVIEMGVPSFSPEIIPTKLELSELNIPQGTLNIKETKLNVSAVSMGNPHLITIVKNLDKIPFELLGKELEIHRISPLKTNVHFVQILDKNNIRVKVWERGCGPTLACGTGACACLVICYRLNLTNNKANVYLPGGILNISWPNVNSTVFMKGPADYIYSGFFEISGSD